MRRLQLKHLLILLLRVLIIVLIALALARPLLKNRFAFAGGRTKTSVVIILDNSYSMGYQGIRGERFEIAKGMALEIAQSLQRGDSASVILMSRYPRPTLPQTDKRPQSGEGGDSAFPDLLPRNARPTKPRNGT